jgi:hypothetical protein
MSREHGDSSGASMIDAARRPKSMQISTLTFHFHRQPVADRWALKAGSQEVRVSQNQSMLQTGLARDC